MTRRPLALIPARGGSKRFPRKNLALLGGKPLIAWTIDRAKASGLFDAVWVSSEDEAILEAARAHGAATLKRPAGLAGDLIPLEPVCRDALEQTGDRGYTDIFLLLPTTPFREPASLRAAWEAFLTSGADALLSVVPCPHPPQWALRIADGRWLTPNDPENYPKERKLLETLYRHDGAYCIARVEPFLRTGSFAGGRTQAYPMSDPMESVDIDTPMDLAFAEFLLARRGGDAQT